MKVEELILLIDLLDKLGYNTETAGTGTVFQRLAQIADYVDTLETNLGTTGDAANAAGTALARLAEVLARLTTTRAEYLDAAISTRLGAISVQRGSTSLLAGTGTTVTISAINIAKSFLLVYTQYGGRDIAPALGFGYISGSTSIYLGRGPGDYSGTIYWEVVSFA